LKCKVIEAALVMNVDSKSLNEKEERLSNIINVNYLIWIQINNELNLKEINSTKLLKILQLL
jgi:hypothetical protein